jgi:protein-S-isoprenylcysteine O-methyltransferase Ste14
VTEVLAWTVVLLNVGYGLLLGARMLAGRARRLAPRPTAPAPIATRHVRSQHGAVALVLVLSVAAVYYGALIAWLAGVPIPGGALMESTWLTYAVGLLLSVAGLVLMGWTYAIFGSWRWRAEVSPGHQLVTRGPFRLVRHPIYLSFTLFYLGAYFLLPFTVFLLHAVASFLAYDYRARAEEGVLLDAFGDDYRSYRARTSRFFPPLY